MNTDERYILPRMSQAEHDLYRQLFGNASIPPKLKPAPVEWANGLDVSEPFIRYPKFVDPRPRFHVKGVGVVIGERRLLEVTTPEEAAQAKAKQRREYRKKQLRKNAA